MAATTYGKKQKTTESVLKKRILPDACAVHTEHQCANENNRIAPAPNIVYFDTFDTTIRKGKLSESQHFD